MAYSSVSIIALVVLLISNYDLLFMRRSFDEIPAHRQYRFFLISVASFFIADMLWGFFSAYNVRGPDYAVTVAFFIIMSISVFLWSIYVVAYLGKHRIFSPLSKIVGLVLMVGGITLIIINFFKPIMFEFTEEEGYVAHKFREYYFMVQATMFLLTALYAFIFAGLNKEKSVKRKHLAIGIFGLEMAAMIAVQIFFPKAPIYAFGYFLGLLVVNTFVVAEQKKEYRVALEEGRYREEKQKEELGTAKQLAYTDSLTGAKSKHAYVEMEEKIDRLIAEDKMGPFSVIVLDLNDLKYINDRLGHDDGDQYLIDSANIIRKFFPNSDLYRFGGDEFVLFIDGKDFETRHDVLNAFNKLIEHNFETGEPIIATGISDFRHGKDNTFRAVFERADERMYIRKKQLKDKGRINILKIKQSKMNAESYEEFMKAELNRIREENEKSTNPRMGFYKLFYRNEEYSLIDLLNNSSCDEVIELDTKTNVYKQLFHVDGKYFVPTVESAFDDLFDFVSKYIVHPDDKDIYTKFMNYEGLLERLRNSEIPNFACEQFRYKLQDGSYRYVEQCVITGLENGIPDGVVRIYVFDVQNYKSRQTGSIGNERLLASSGRDSNTNLLLEKEFLLKAQEAIINEPDLKWCLISCDIIHFRFFDEWFGREAGDLLLAKIGATLAEHEAILNAVTGYFGKDDFAVLMPYNEEAIKKLYESIREKIMSFGSTAGFTPAFGIAMAEKGMALVDVFDRATIATAKAKSDITNRIVVYTSEMQFLAQKEYRLLSEYMQALKNNEITFYLQPQCRISTGRIVGVESLARWIKKDGTFVPPNTFIPVLEKYGFIPDLDMYLWDKACCSLREWLDAGHLAVPVSLNVSRADLFAIDIAEYFIKLTEKYNIPHNLIKIEITESSYVEATELVDNLVEKLHDNGFMVLMDDFGSGYSSLNMLSNLKLDAIKLDGRFLRLNDDDNKAIHILESVVNMAKVIALPIIVEGVETKDQADFLENLGCRYIQGYYFYKPMPVDDFRKIMADENKVDNRGFVVKLNEQVRIREFLDKNVYSDSMLNNIIGPVAFYSWDGEKTDIVRFNEQFYKAVHIQEFADRLEHIEQFIHPDDAIKMHNAFNRAMENKLNGSNETLRFFAPDGTVLSFFIHFYYIGKKEGGERFYGAAQNVTELSDLKEEVNLIAHYSKDNLIFLRKVNNTWLYSVASRGLSDLFDLTPAELEKELNDHEFGKKRAVSRKKFDEFAKSFHGFADKKRNFHGTLDVFDGNHHMVTLDITFTCVSGQSNNIAYVMKATYTL